MQKALTKTVIRDGYEALTTLTHGQKLPSADRMNLNRLQLSVVGNLDNPYRPPNLYLETLDKVKGLREQEDKQSKCRLVIRRIGVEKITLTSKCADICPVFRCEKIFRT